MVLYILLAIACLACAVTMIRGGNPGFTSFYDEIMCRAPFADIPRGTGLSATSVRSFWQAVDLWLAMALILAAVLIFMGVYLDRSEKARRQVTLTPVFLFVAASMGLYYLTCIKFARYDLKLSHTHVELFAIAALAFVSEIVSLIRSRKNGDKKETKSMRKNEIKFVLVSVVLFAVTIPLWLDAYNICKSYSVNYGIYGQTDHTMRSDILDDLLGNYINRSVDTEDGLYFLSRGDKGYGYTQVKKLSADGEITTVYEGEYEFQTISAEGGDLYLSSRYFILKLDPETSSCEEIVEPQEGYRFMDLCTADGNLYYLECRDDSRTRYEATTDRLYGGVERDGAEKRRGSFILVSSIEGGALSEPELYIGDVDYGTVPSDLSADEIFPNVLDIFVAGDGIDQYAYGAYSDQMVDTRGGITLYGGHIYYTEYTDTGVDIVRSDLDGSNAEVIDSYTFEPGVVGGEEWDGSEMGVRYALVSDIRIMIGQGKILLVWQDRYDYELVEEEPWMHSNGYDLLYVTDLP